MYKFNKRKISYILLLFLFLTYYYFINVYFGFYIPCIFNKTTKLLCPGCGVSRMLISISRFDFYTAFTYNPIIFCGLPFILYILTKQTFHYITDTKFIMSKIENCLLFVFLIILLLFGIIRNFF